MQITRLAGALLAISLPASAQAAPQMLGLAMTHEAVPLVCKSGACTVELSAICLQHSRREPREGTVYNSLKPTAITLTFTLRDGSTVTRSSTGLARLSSTRGYVAVKLSLPQSTLASMKAVSVTARVGKLVSLVPHAVPGDKTPHTKAEIAAVSQKLRAMADPIIDRNDPPAVAARLANRMMNALAAGDDTNRQWRRSVWSKALKGTRLDGEAEAGIRIARKLHRSCAKHHPIPGNYRACLANGHDRLISNMNRQYWRIVGAGS